MSEMLYNKLRPESFEDIVGQQSIISLLNSFLNKNFLPSMIFFGPPGTGKTTIARIVAKKIDAKIYYFSGVKDSVSTIQKQIYEEHQTIFARKQIVFIDEIHRYNKSRQDIFLPMIEDYGVILIGATTENPSFYINNALISRMRMMKFEYLNELDILKVLKRGVNLLNFKAKKEQLIKIAKSSNGDLRFAINTLESAFFIAKNQELTDDILKKVVLNFSRDDKKNDAHYRIISSFIKSLRGSDPDASLYYLIKMLDGGEDPIFILRRMIIFASEDVGNADPRALQIAVNGLTGFQAVGMPEGKIILYQIVTYLASAPKSNASYVAGNKATEFFEKNKNLEIPSYLINQTSLVPNEKQEQYKYPHDFEKHFVKQRYFPGKETPPKFYELSNMGYEAKLKLFLKQIKD